MLFANAYTTTTTTTTTTLESEEESTDLEKEILYTKEYFHEMQDDIDLVKNW